MTVRFPRRRQDGTFELELVFSVGGTMQPAGLARWLADWADRNRAWPPVPGAAIVEVLRWTDAYSGAPSIARVDEDCVTLKWTATPEATLWKDWVAKLALDLTAAYPVLVLERVTHPESG